MINLDKKSGNQSFELLKEFMLAPNAEAKCLQSDLFVKNYKIEKFTAKGGDKFSPGTILILHRVILKIKYRGKNAEIKIEENPNMIEYWPNVPSSTYEDLVFGVIEISEKGIIKLKVWPSKFAVPD